MSSRTSRLLITLVLLAVAATAACWTTAQARPRWVTHWGRSHVSGGVVIGRPGMRPASGEPDTGASKNPPLVLGRTGTIVEEPVDDPGNGPSVWFNRIGMIWMARYLGGR